MNRVVSIPNYYVWDRRVLTKNKYVGSHPIGRGVRTKSMRPIFGASAALVIALAGSTVMLPATAAAGKYVIHIKGFKFQPTPLRIHVGDRVHFVNDDDEAHTVTAKDKSFDSEGLDSGKSWDHVFSRPGTYVYFCELHPYMKATVEVSK